MTTKHRIYKIVLAAVFVSVLIMVLVGYFSRNTSFDIDEAKFEDLMKQPDAVIIDVRTAGEFSKERIKGAILLDYNSPSFKDQIKRFRKDKTYLLYCKSGNISSKACEIMSEFGFKECYNLKHGINGWKNSHRPIVN